MKIVVTGATGFVGKALVVDLLANSFEIKALVRQSSVALPLAVEQVVVGDLSELALGDSSGFLREAFIGVDVVVHTAARVHVMNDDASDPLNEFRKVNCDATLILARLAAESGVKRFVFLSSIKVGGETSEIGHPLNEKINHIPTDPYGLSKYEAEEQLKKLSKSCSMEIVIIRPALVYGPGVQANFETMMKWLSKGIPLPLGATTNKRSLVSLDNLVDFISVCMEHPKAANETFFISDDNDLSTTQMLRKLSHGLGKRCFLVPVPSKLLSLVLWSFGLKSFSQRLLGSLQVSTTKAKNLLDWAPKVTVDEALQETANFYKKE